jgi:hypothetical protein
MNLVDCVVVEVLGWPHEAHGKWWIPVCYDSWGRVSETKLMFDSEAEALAVSVGHQFLA